MRQDRGAGDPRVTKLTNTGKQVSAQMGAGSDAGPHFYWATMAHLRCCLSIGAVTVGSPVDVKGRPSRANGLAVGRPDNLERWIDIAGGGGAA